MASATQIPSGSLSRSSRIAPHSHIRGLGLGPDGLVEGDAAGFVGQNTAREVGFVDPRRVFTGSQIVFNLYTGMRRRCRAHQVAQVFRTCVAPRRRAWNWQNRPRTRNCTGTRRKGPILSDGRQRSL